jgi:hypothetical protein
VRDAFATLKRGDGADDSSDLPFINVEVFLNGFGRKEGTAGPGAFGELLQSCFGGVIEAN